MNITKEFERMKFIKLTQQQLDQAYLNLKKENPDKFVEIFRAPHLYISEDEVVTKINDVEQAHKGWKTTLSGYIEENGMKRAVVLHYKI